LFKRSSDNLITTWDWMALNLRKVFKLGILLWRDHFLHLTLLSFLRNSRGRSPLNFCFFSWRKQDTIIMLIFTCAFFYFLHNSLVFRIFVWNNCNWKDLPYYSVEEKEIHFVYYNFYKTVDTNIPFEKFCSKITVWYSYR